MAISETIGSTFVAIPKSLLQQVLRDGYRATIRDAVPLSGTPTQAIDAFRRHHDGDVVVLTVLDLVGSDLTVTRDALGAPVRLNSRHLPGNFLAHVYYSVGQDGPPVYEWTNIEAEKVRSKNETGKKRVRVYRHRYCHDEHVFVAYNTKTKTWV